MGVWGYGVFDDDTAYDVFYHLKDKELSDIEKVFDNYIDCVVSSDYIDYQTGVYGLVAAAIVDINLNNAIYDNDQPEYLTWINSLKEIDFSPMRKKAAKVVTAIIGDNSELNQLWGESDEHYMSWQDDKLKMIKRLSE